MLSGGALSASAGLQSELVDSRATVTPARVAGDISASMQGRARTALLVALMALGVAPGIAAAADPPDPGVTQSFEFDSGGVAFPYLVYTPTSYSRARPAPLLVMVHGCQTTAEQQMRANLSTRRVYKGCGP